MKVEVNNAQQNEQVDWSKNPQLVISIKDDRTIVLVSKNQANPRYTNCFIGTSLNYEDFSICDDNWIKEDFKPFHGTITLQND